MRCNPKSCCTSRPGFSSDSEKALKKKNRNLITENSPGSGGAVGNFRLTTGNDTEKKTQIFCWDCISRWLGLTAFPSWCWCSCWCCCCCDCGTNRRDSRWHRERRWTAGGDSGATFWATRTRQEYGAPSQTLGPPWSSWSCRREIQTWGGEWRWNEKGSRFHDRKCNTEGQEYSSSLIYIYISSAVHFFLLSVKQKT